MLLAYRVVEEKEGILAQLERELDRAKDKVLHLVPLVDEEASLHEEKCHICEGLVELSETIQHADRFVRVAQENVVF